MSKHNVQFNKSLFIIIDDFLTWTSIVRHMAQGDFIDSCDTITEMEKQYFKTDSYKRQLPIKLQFTTFKNANKSFSLCCMNLQICTSQRVGGSRC